MVDFRWMRAIDRLLCLDGALTLLLAGDSQVVASTNSTRSRSRRVSRHEYERLRSTWRNDDDELLFFFCGVSRRNNALGDWLISVGRWHTHTHTYYVSSAVEHDWKYSSVCNGDTRNAQKLEERKSCAMRGPNPVTSRNEMSRPEYLYRLCGLCVCVCVHGRTVYSTTLLLLLPFSRREHGGGRLPGRCKRSFARTSQSGKRVAASWRKETRVAASTISSTTTRHTLPHRQRLIEFNYISRAFSFD